MKWDNVGLPYIDKEGEDSLKCLSIYFVNVFCYKYFFDKTFKEAHPTRERRPDESFEEYDDYITMHLNAYREMLEKQNIQYIQEADINFYTKMTFMRSLKNKALQTHPVLKYGEFDKDNIQAAVAALTVYDFQDIAKEQPHLNSLLLKAATNVRLHTYWNYIGDTLLLLKSIFGNVETSGLLLVASKKNPTVISKLACRLYQFRSQSGILWKATLDYIKE